jgi:acyl-CoA thioesterase-1
MRNIFTRRFRSRLLVVLVATLAFGCGGQERPAPPTPPEPSPEGAGREAAADPVRIAFLGDSLSAGYGLPESAAFPALVEERLRQRGHTVDVLNAGVSGDTTAGGLSRLDWVLRSVPDLLVVQLGGNDALCGQPLDNTERNLREIVRRGRAAGACVLLLGMDVPSNYGPRYATGFAELYVRIAEEEQVEFLPGFIREIALDASLMMPDGLHPTAEGHLQLAKTLVAALEPMLPAGISRNDPRRAPSSLSAASRRDPDPCRCACRA